MEILAVNAPQPDRFDKKKNRSFTSSVNNKPD